MFMRTNYFNQRSYCPRSHHECAHNYNYDYAHNYSYSYNYIFHPATNVFLQPFSCSVKPKCVPIVKSSDFAFKSPRNRLKTSDVSLPSEVFPAAPRCLLRGRFSADYTKNSLKEQKRGLPFDSPLCLIRCSMPAAGKWSTRSWTWSACRSHHVPFSSSGWEGS